MGSVISSNAALDSQRSVQQMYTFRTGHLVTTTRPTATRASAGHTTNSAKHTSEQVSHYNRHLYQTFCILRIVYTLLYEVSILY